MKNRVLIAAMLLSLLGGCEAPDNNEVMLITVQPRQLSIKVPAKGEVVAAKSTQITVPDGRNGAQTVAWLLAENTAVKKGDVIAKFDGETFVTNRDNTQLDLNLAKLDSNNQSQVINSEKADIKSDTLVVDSEIAFSQQFIIDDLTVYSRNDIIDGLDNREYLLAQKGFLNWKLDNFSFNSASEMALMELRAQQYQTKLSQYETALTQLEVYAPHDGIVQYEQNWRGEKPRIGQTLWPGQKLARLPDLTTLQAKLFVLESEADKVQAQDPVEIRLDAEPDTLYQGKVIKKDNIAKAIRTGDPVQYFELLVTLDADPQAAIQPGNKVTATIVGVVGEQRLSVPLQAIFSDEQGSFVYAKIDGQMHKTRVTLGMKTFAEAEITSGLKAGQQVALYKPL